MCLCILETAGEYLNHTFKYKTAYLEIEDHGLFKWSKHNGTTYLSTERNPFYEDINDDELKCEYQKLIDIDKKLSAIKKESSSKY